MVLKLIVSEKSMLETRKMQEMTCFRLGKGRVINWQEEGEISHQRAAAMPKCVIGENLSPGRRVPGRR